MAITATEFSATASTTGVTTCPDATAGFLDVLRNYAASFEDRRQVRQMLELDQHLLDDIGLERADIGAALAAPYPQMPSDALQAIRRERQDERLMRLLGH
ncbi:MAG: DUF1127 domain-containing protein [Hyphomicrobiaceae bacterium]